MTGDERDGRRERERSAPDVVVLGQPERARYRWRSPHKPFVHPLRTPAGHVLTVDAPAGHPWHHGLWFALKLVDGVNCWEEGRPDDGFGVARHDDAAAWHVDGDPGESATALSHRLSWQGPDGAVLLDEDRRLAIVPLADDAYALDWTTVLVPRHDVVLDREPYNGIWGGYSGFAFRGRGDLVGTRLLHPEVGETDRLEGVPGSWIDLSGPVDGGEGGVALLDRPGNPHHPVPWYASTEGIIYGDEWGNFVNAAFVWDRPLDAPAGRPLTFAYRVVVHDGVWSADRVEAEHRRWTAAR